MATAPVTWERIVDPLDRRKTVWWRGTWPECRPAYLSVMWRDGAYVWAVRPRPGSSVPGTITGRAATLQTAMRRAERARGTSAAETCPGCGRTFKGARGVRAHQAGRFLSAACRVTP